MRPVPVDPSQGAYEGTWSLGLRSGHGTYMTAHRDMYSGQFHHDTITGYGTMTHANGDVYTGSFVGDRRHGHGCARGLGRTRARERFD